MCVRACVCLRACVLVVGGQDIITIRTSIMTPLSTTVLRVSTARGVGGGGGGGGGGQWFQMHFTLTTLAGLCVRYITMEMSTDVK